MPSELKQQFIPGLEPEKNERVHNAACSLALAERERKAWTSTSKEAHEFLLRVMEEEGLDAYEYGDVFVRINKTSKAKAVVAKSDDEDGA